MLLTLLMLSGAPASAAPARVGNYALGETLEQVQDDAHVSGSRLQAFHSAGRYASYLIWDRNNAVRGSLGLCDGRLQSVILDISSYENTMALLRERTTSWGQPQLSFETLETSDGSATIDVANFDWPSQRYRLQLSTSSAQNFANNQSLGQGLKCI